MSAAPPAAPPPAADPGLNGHAPGHNMNLPRFHPIAINPNGPGSTPSGPPPYHRPYGSPYQDHPPPHHHSSGPRPLPPPLPPAPAPHQYQQHQHQHLQPQSAPSSQQHQQQSSQQHTQPGPPSRPPSHPPILPVPVTSQLDQIEARLRQIEQEEASRAAARAHMLAMRRREDEEFRMVTERAEAEEEELRRRRKRLKRESMGLMDGQMESPPAPAPRRLSETSAATTLAFFKQQTPPEPRQSELRAPAQHQHQQQSHNPSPPAIIQQPTPMAPAPSTSIMSNPHGNTFRKKQKYTIKNAEAWGERHGRPATYDPEGRALWKRPSDGRLVYLDCPAPDCGKSDFVTLHGFMCHLTKKHKDRTLGSQSRALEVCGTVYDPNAPRPQRPSLKRDSSGNSRGGSVHTEPDMDEEEDAYSTSASDVHDDHNTNHHNNGPSPQDDIVKREGTGSPVTSTSAVVEQPSSNKASIASMIDGAVTNDQWPKKSSTPEHIDATAPAPAENESVIATTTAEDAAAAAVLAGQTIQV